MRRLVDGAYAVLSPAEGAWVFCLDGLKRASVAVEEAAELSALAQGIPEDEPEGPLFCALKERGLAAEGLRPEDPIIEERLEALGRGYAWLLEAFSQGPKLAERLRRVHARRKVFFPAYGQTPLLPELAALRCLHLAEHLEPGARVLHAGDDDLLSVGMAALGFDVVACDIDEALIRFLSLVAKDEGLSLHATVQDLCAPVPEAWIGAFDAAMTDPMSFEPCQLAFLSRAVVAVREGGIVSTTVHPLARPMVERVYAKLPVRRRSILAERLAYANAHYRPSACRGDLVLLEREAGDPPFGANDRIPFEDVASGDLVERMHGVIKLASLPARTDERRERAVAALRAVLAAALGRDAVVEERAGGHVHLFAPLGDGFCALSYEPARGRVRVSLFPTTWEEALTLQEALGRALRALREEISVFPAPLAPPERLPRTAQGGG